MIVLCGKSASGKDAVKSFIVSGGMKPIVTYTTRPPRKGEIDGVSYHFITEEDFLKKQKDEFFLENTSYHVADGSTWYYGTAADDFTEDGVIILNPDGLRAIQPFKKDKRIRVYYLFCDESVRERRIMSRKCDPEESKRRLKADNIDFKNINDYIDFSIKNQNRSPDMVADIILKIEECF